MGDMSWLKELAVYGPTTILFGLVVFSALKALPTWKELRLAELKYRNEDLKVRSQQLEVLRGVTDTLKDVVEIHGKQSELTGIAQRSAADRQHRMEEVLQHAVQRLSAVENQLRFGGPNQKPTVEMSK